MKIKVQYTVKLTREQELSLIEQVEKAFDIPADEIRKSDLREFLVLRGVPIEVTTSASKLKIKKGRKTGIHYTV